MQRCELAMLTTMLIRVVEFSREGYIQNLKDFWLKINIQKRKLLKIGNSCSGTLSKIGHHFGK